MRQFARNGKTPIHMRGLLWFCFAFSGAAALALEMLWIRSAGLVLGTTVFKLSYNAEPILTPFSRSVALTRAEQISPA